jgi:hypothetical protein
MGGIARENKIDERIDTPAAIETTQFTFSRPYGTTI